MATVKIPQTTPSPATTSPVIPTGITALSRGAQSGFSSAGATPTKRSSAVKSCSASSTETSTKTKTGHKSCSTSESSNEPSSASLSPKSSKSPTKRVASSTLPSGSSPSPSKKPTKKSTEKPADSRSISPPPIKTMIYPPRCPPDPNSQLWRAAYGYGPDLTPEETAIRRKFIDEEMAEMKYWHRHPEVLREEIRAWDPDYENRVILPYEPSEEELRGTGPWEDPASVYEES